MKRIGLVLLCNVRHNNYYGGQITYTAHLYHALRQVGCEPIIFKPGKVMTPVRDFGYGCEYRTLPVDEMLRQSDWLHIVGCTARRYDTIVYQLLDQGFGITIHDPNCFNYYDDVSWKVSDHIILIRTTNQPLCPHGCFIRHPFVRYYRKTPQYGGRPWKAVTLSRLGAIKRTTWVLDANRKLPPDSQIWLRGYDDRFFTYTSVICKGYTEFKQDGQRPEGEKMGFPREMGAAQKIASQANYLVDLTDIKGDGGGTQYSFLEALDAGCCLILNRAWICDGSIWQPGENCWAVGSPDELVEAILDPMVARWRVAWAKRAAEQLVHHEPSAIAQEYLECFGRWKKQQKSKSRPSRSKSS